MRALVVLLLSLQLAGASAIGEGDSAAPAFDLRARRLQGLPSSMAALMLAGETGGQLLFSALALPLGPASAAGGADGEPRHLVALLVEVEGGSLLDATSPDPTELDIYAYALTPAGSVAAFSSQLIPIDLDSFGEAVAAGGVKLLTHLELEPGSYRLRILTHEPSSRRFGLREIPLDVPGRRSALSVPLFPEPPAPWVLVAEPGAGEGSGIDFETLTGRTGAPVPSALPVVAGEAAEFEALLFGADTGAAPQIRARLRPIEDGPTRDTGVTVVEQAETAVPGARRLRLRLPLDQIASGSYFLKLTARLGRVELESPEVGVIVFADPLRETLVWTDVQRLVRGDPPRAELEIGRSRRAVARKRELVAAVSAAYRTVLERLATGDWDGAVDDLLRVERRAIEEQQQDGFALARRAQEAVHEELAAQDPEALVAIARFHQEAHRNSRDRHRYGLAAHSRAVAALAAEQYAAGGGEDAEAIAAGLLAALGDELQQAHLYQSARRYLRRATEIEPSNTFALLQLAVGLERAGDYAGTVAVLERLVEAHPKAPEARLRLGVTLLRLGREGAGIATLERLVREQNPDWVLAVAYETLAMGRLRKGDPDRALALLEEGLVRLPGQERLTLQLAYTLERAGRRARSHRVLEALPDSGGDTPSPRHVYSLWPSGGREETEETLARAAMLRVPALARALAATRGEERGR